MSEILEAFISIGKSVIVFRAGSEVAGTWALTHPFPHALSTEKFRIEKKYSTTPTKLGITFSPSKHEEQMKHSIMN